MNSLHNKNSTNKRSKEEKVVAEEVESCNNNNTNINLNKKDPCKKYACDLQFCLSRNNYNQDKCQDIINILKECCLRTYNPSDRDLSPTCSGFIKK